MKNLHERTWYIVTCIFRLENINGKFNSENCAKDSLNDENLHSSNTRLDFEKRFSLFLMTFLNNQKQSSL